MTATVLGVTRSWAAAHRRMLALATFALALAAAVTVAIVMLVSSSSSSAPSTPGTTTSDWPIPPENLTDEQKCELAHVRVC
jgi:hypothetical protein